MERCEHRRFYVGIHQRFKRAIHYQQKVKTSWQEITDSYKKGYPDKDAMGKLTFHRDEIRWVNESAYIAQVIGRWEVIQKHTPTHDTLSGRFSLIFVGTPEGPKIQIDHTW